MRIASRSSRSSRFQVFQKPLRKNGIGIEVAIMLLKFKKFARPFNNGLLTGASAHVVAHLVILSAEWLAHFVGHVVAVIVLRLIQ